MPDEAIRVDVGAAHLQKFLTHAEQKKMNQTSSERSKRNKANLSANCKMCCEVTLHVTRAPKKSKISTTFYRKVNKKVIHLCPEECAPVLVPIFDEVMKPVYKVLRKVKGDEYFEVSVQNKPEHEEGLLYAMDVAKEDPFFKLAVNGFKDDKEGLKETFAFPKEDKTAFLKYILKHAFFPVILTLHSVDSNVEPEYIKGTLRVSVKKACNEEQKKKFSRKRISSRPEGKPGVKRQKAAQRGQSVTARRSQPTL